MANKVNAIMIDPETKNIYPITVTGGAKGFKEIYEQVGCKHLEVGMTFQERNCLMYVDEEGWCHDSKRDTFDLQGVKVPSKAVIVKTNNDGYAIDFPTTEMFSLINNLVKEVEWLGKKSYNEVYANEELHEYTDEETIAYYQKQFGCDKAKAKQMMKLFGKVMGY